MFNLIFDHPLRFTASLLEFLLQALHLRSDLNLKAPSKATESNLHFKPVSLDQVVRDKSSQVLEGGKDKVIPPQLKDEVLKPSNQEQEPWAEAAEKLQPGIDGKTSTASRAKGTNIIQMQGPQVLSHRVACWKSGISYLDIY